jgi:hypothetical protein
MNFSLSPNGSKYHKEIILHKYNCYSRENILNNLYNFLIPIYKEEINLFVYVCLFYMGFHETPFNLPTINKHKSA